MSEKASKGRFLKPEKLQNHSNEEKGKDKKKERGEGKKSNGCALSFYNSYFGNRFWPKKLVGRKTGPFGDNVFENPGRCK